MVFYPAVKTLGCPDIRLSIIHLFLKDFFKDSDFLKKIKYSATGKCSSIYTGIFFKLFM
jgi:hypothetical protein